MLSMNYFAHIKRLLTSHKKGVIAGGLIGSTLLIIGFFEHSFTKTLAYLITLFICFLIAEWICFIKNEKHLKWEIRKPRTELKIILICQLIAAGLLMTWFWIIDPASGSPMLRISLMILRLLFIFPIFFLIYFKLIKKYAWKDLGFRSNLWFVLVPMILIIGGTSLLFFPDGIQFQEIINTRGVLSMLVLGFLTAAIPEELTRHLFQTRLSEVIQSNDLGWLIASIFWAAIHIPSFSTDGAYLAAAKSAFGILPIGLFWGYLNQRFRSILPSIVIHGTNLWGLQNIF
jgi:membrane protease YdiL (CAAX protease family)